MFKEMFTLKELNEYVTYNKTYVKDRINDELILLENGETIIFNIKNTYEMK